ncbi:MFS transporter [Paenalkalicoccus suaedae]|uniref:MFS transporter n=1 Tax=Paenalkalicoccus suaedae TaxID=2592382 RepID=A0A859FE06_9BACI|nr:MFS transporter [Paenalkalicoccus suaedae]QKS71327.1 MFS transporter [Paenalkalicoccus suaedae]
MKQTATWKLKGTLFFFHATMTIIISYLPVYFQYLGLEPGEIGILLAVGPAAAILAQPFWGFMSDKWKTVRKILLLCLTSGLIIGFFLFQLSEYLLIIPIIFLFFAFLSPAGGLGDSLAQKVAVSRGVSFGSIRMWGSLGFATSSLVSGYLLSIIGIEFIYSVFALLLTIAIVFAFLSPDSEPSKKPVYLSQVGQLLKEKRLLVFLLFILSISLTHRMNDNYMGLYIVELGADEATIGLAWFIGVLAEAIVFATSAIWLARFKPLTLIMFAAFLYVIRWGIMFIVPDASYVLAIQALHGLAFATFYLTGFQFVSRLVPSELESTGHLLFISVFFGLSGVIGSLIGGTVIQAFDVRSLYAVMAGLAFIGFIASILYRHYYTEKKVAT